MKFTLKLEKFFILAIFVPLIYVGLNWYQSYQFKNNPISVDIQKRIDKAEVKVLNLIQEKFNTNLPISLVVSDEFHSNLYGLTSYKDNKITIYLNKKRFKESENYMIDEVIPHEYAHAMVFVLGKKTTEDGHTKLWQKICIELEGKQCIRYVDNEEIVRRKMSL
ncbi:SprT-like domain-containing protein [Sulfurimonas sp. MAG313]|nr:SprT-like domain-containing protein [Sulfurimonas sp. MAG313]MDF1880225.1 SprT-like domain-containing protein [Sulfurimonas sp. MAG313]